MYIAVCKHGRISRRWKDTMPHLDAALFLMTVVARMICNVVARQPRKNLNRPAAYINTEAYNVGGLASM